jgi:hypothetical protein
MRFSIVLLALLAGCAAFQSQKFTGPNGQPAYLMQCSGVGNMLQSCEKRADKFCPDGYTVVDRPTGVPDLPQLNGGTLVTPEHSMAIECKRKAG